MFICCIVVLLGMGFLLFKYLREMEFFEFEDVMIIDVCLNNF